MTPYEVADGPQEALLDSIRSTCDGIARWIIDGMVANGNGDDDADLPTIMGGLVLAFLQCAVAAPEWARAVVTLLPGLNEATIREMVAQMPVEVVA